ncbi:MAG: sulfatase-like hydrolase/transferase [Akkermansiaceae bacterium]|nr:sulfatase-like hydrolase/transferase [Akkermansiaceae bacterium]
MVWIVIEDASPHIGCYGETLIKTPNIDRMSREGIRCSSAFVTAPVCSSSRSA